MAEKIGLEAVFDVSQFNRGLDEYVAGINSISSSSDKMLDFLDDIAFESKQSTKALDEISSALNDLVSEMTSLNAPSDDVVNDIDDIGKESVSSENEVSSFGDTLKIAIGTTIGNLASAAATAVIDAISQIGGAIIGLGKDSIGMAIDFEASMTSLQIAASSSGKSFDELKAASLAIGGASDLVGVSASGAAEAMTGLYKAGLTTTEIFGDFNKTLEDGSNLSGALRAAIDLAAATELDMVQASDLAAIALASFGGELLTEAERAEFVNTAMNNFVQAADASVAEVGGLAEALKMVGPTAGSMGLSIQDVNNALAVLSTRGIQGSAAGSNLNSMLSNLLSPSQQAAGIMKELGIEVFDTEGNFKSITDIVGEFEEATRGMTDAEKADQMGRIFTIQGLRAMESLLAGGVQGMNDMADATAGAATIQEQAAAKSKTLQGQMEALDGIIETLKIQFGDALLPVVESVVGVFTKFAEDNGPALVKSIGEIVGPIAKLIEYFSNTISTGDSLNDFLTEVPDNIRPIAKAIADLVTGQRKLSEFFAVFEPFGETLQEVGGIVSDVFETAYQIIVENVGPSVVELIDTLSEMFSNLGITWEDVGMVLGAVFTVLGGIIVAAIGIIIAGIDALVVMATTLYETFEETLGFLGAAWESLWVVIDSVVNAVQAAIRGDWSAAMKYMETAGQAAWSVLRNTFSAAWAFVSGIIETFTSGIREFINTIIDFFQELYDKLVGNSIIPDMINGIIGWFQTLYDTGARLIGDLVTFIEGAWVTIKNNIPAAWAAITTAIDTAIRAIPGAVTEAIATVIQIGKDMVTKIGEGITTTWDTVVNAAIQAAVKGMSLAEDAIGALISFGGSIVSNIKSGIEGAWDTITGAMNWLIENGLSIGEGAMSALAGIGTAIVGAIKKAILASGGIAEALRSVVVSGINEVIDTINSLIDSLNEILMIDLPKLPRLASGVMNFAGGMAMVGENGPEIVYIPQGANVYPTNSQVPQSNYAMTTNNVSNQIFNLNINGDASDGIQSQATDALRELQVSAILRR